jgi:hypothetical protein
MYIEDFIRARVDREHELAKPLDNLHAQVGQGEVAAGWLVMNDGNGKVPFSWLKQWWGEERLPDDWKKPSRVIGLWEARQKANFVADGMSKLRI